MEVNELLKRELEKRSVVELDKMLGPLEKAVHMDPQDGVLLSLFVTVLGIRNAKRDSAIPAQVVPGKRLGDMFEGEGGEVLHVYLGFDLPVELRGRERIQRFYARWSVGDNVPENWLEEVSK